MEPIEGTGQSHSLSVKGSSSKINVLVVDDDSTCLLIVAAILRTWQYEVVTVKHPIDALATLRENQDSFDLVVTDYHMPDMNGLELQDQVLEEFKLPFDSIKGFATLVTFSATVMSGEERECIMLESLERGAASYLSKPIRPEHLKNLWQYTAAAKKGKSIVIEEETRFAPVTPIWGHHIDITHRGNENSSSYMNKMMDFDSDDDEDSDTEPQEKNMDDNHKPRKPKIVWTTALQNRFLQAIDIIGFENAVPRRILDVMNVPGITRAHVASHLQKYRLFLKKVAEKGLKYNIERAQRSSFASALYGSGTSREYRYNLLRRHPWTPTFHSGLLGGSSTNMNYSSYGIVPFTGEGSQWSNSLSKLGVDKSPSVTDQASSSKCPILGNTYPLSQPDSSSLLTNQLNTIGSGWLKPSDAIDGTYGISKQMTPQDQTIPENLHHGIQKYATVEDGTKNANHASISGSGYAINSFPNVNPYETIGYVGLQTASSSELVRVGEAKFPDAAKPNKLGSANINEGTSFMAAFLGGHQKERLLLSDGLSKENENRCACDAMKNSGAPFGNFSGQMLGGGTLTDALSGRSNNQPHYKPQDGENLMPSDITSVPYQPNVNALTIENQNPNFLEPNHVGDHAAWNNVDVQRNSNSSIYAGYHCGQDPSFGEFMDFDFDFLRGVESFLLDDHWPLFDQNPAQEFDETGFVASLLGDN
ncbi:putative two-component response regulator ARR13 [Rhodamnia argentea]|uniref:Two-component response regulator ARR13 n=1 Tax=Rhodamnia argentea TaxID=178133 RepID=A0A8B8PGA6_9MYRT|nr:putative two-component response regulator ARR13 [Rhodamnia argentea]